MRPDSDVILRAALALAGLMLFAAGLLAGGLAAEHMSLARSLCGSQAVAHCGWCASAAALALSGLSAVIFALAPRPFNRRARAS